MEITVDELEQPGNGYVIYDMRSEDERAYGSIPGAVPTDAETLLASPPRETERPIVVVCARGVLSVDVADRLCEAGCRAYSLAGGYAAWLRREIAKQEAGDVRERVEQSIRTRFKTVLLSRFVRAIKDYRLIRDGDRIAVCISGGKDSMLMAKLFEELHRHSQWDFEVQYLVMDPGYNESNRRIIETNARNLGIPITIFESNIFESVYHIEKSPCYLCARMRRGHLYSYARELGCNKIALGHHYDDVIETILMGMLYGSQIQTMMPKLHSTNFDGMELIRPMYLIREDDIKAWRCERSAFYPVRLQVYRYLHHLRRQRKPLQAAGNQGADPRAEKDQPRGGERHFPQCGECLPRHRDCVQTEGDCPSFSGFV